MHLDSAQALRQLNWQKINFKPNPIQQRIYQHQARTRLISGGEGSGKSLVTAMEYVGLYPAFRLTYIVAPKYQSAFAEFDYIAASLMQMGRLTKQSISRPNHGAAKLVTLDGCVVETLSSEDGTKSITGTGKSPDMIMMVEAGKQSYDIYLACRARVARSRGLLILSGTIEESERWYPELIQRWQADNPEGARSFILPTWSNTALYPRGEDDDEIKALKATFPPDKFLERFGAVPCPPSTLVFREFSFTDHVKQAPYWQGDKEWTSAPVELAVDPGYAGAYAVLALQWQGDTVYVIDEVYRQHAVAEEVIAECKMRQWWGKVKGGVIDIAGRQHQGLPSHVEIWSRQAGISLRSNSVRVDDGITRHRTFLRNPVTGSARLFHDPRCKDTLREYGAYKYRAVVDGRPTSEEPIDANNHALKALAYWLYDRFGATDANVSRINKPKPHSVAFLLKQ